MSSEDTFAEKAAEKVTASYLIFRLGGELFGTDLLNVLEVMKLPGIKPVPYMKPAFKGVLNLRGQIVSVIDLRQLYEMKVDQPDEGMILIIETAEAPIGAIVDDLVSVEMIHDDELDRQPVIETKVPSQFLQGIAKKNERLMTLIDISGCLASTEMRARQKGKAA